MARLVVGLCVLLLTSQSFAASVYLTRGDDKGMPLAEPVAKFNCSDKVIGVVTGSWPAGSEHRLEARWNDPKGKQREHTRYQFVARQGQTRVWVWLRMHRGQTDMLDRLLMQEDDGMQEFRGRWNVDFTIDGEKLQRIKFDVDC
jgi:hypothetical protein